LNPREVAENATESGDSQTSSPTTLTDPDVQVRETLSAETIPDDSIDVVEVALADALRRAAEARQWTTVEVLSRELGARRQAHAPPNVVPLRRDRG
jgi:hypothetical protein